MPRNASRSRIAAALTAARTVHLSTHLDPDADGIGSMLALRLALRCSGKRVLCFAPSPVSSLHDFLPGYDAIELLDERDRASRMVPADVQVALDCGDLERVGAPVALRRRTLINIDHHATNDRFGDLDLVDGRAACTAILLDGVLRALGTELDPAMATCLYAAVVFDTGRFLHENTDARVLRFAARLVAVGADLALVNRRLCASRSEHDLAIEALGLRYLRRDRRDPRIAGIALPAAAIAEVGEPEDWGDLVEIPRSIAGVEMAYLLRERRGGVGPEVKVSLRSNRPYQVGPVAAELGGGGHDLAAGATVAGGLAGVERRLLTLLRRRCEVEATV